MSDENRRWINQERIFHRIWQAGSISRSEVARDLQVDKATVTHAVNDLIKVRLVHESATGKAGPQGGRRPVSLVVQAEAAGVIGVRIQGNRFSAVLVNLAGVPVARADFEDAPIGPDLRRHIETACERAALAFADSGIPVAGFGVGLSAIVDPDRHLLVRSNPYGLETPRALPSRVASLDRPIWSENDANCCALGELVFHKTSEFRNYLFALAEVRSDRRSVEDAGGLGIGLGLVLGGHLFRGPSCNAGEFRSVLWNQGQRSQLGMDPAALQHLLDDAEVMTRAMEEFGLNLALLANTLDLDAVIIGGEIERSAVDVPSIIGRIIRTRHLYSEREILVRWSTLGHDTVAYGAAGMAMDRLLQSGQLTSGLLSL